jgi:NADH-quinone oxidoreductase subunit M
VFFGKIENKENESLKDLSFREHSLLIPLVILIFAIGIYPKYFMNYFSSPVKGLVKTSDVPQNQLQAEEIKKISMDDNL